MQFEPQRSTGAADKRCRSFCVPKVLLLRCSFKNWQSAAVGASGSKTLEQERN